MKFVRLLDIYGKVGEWLRADIQLLLGLLCTHISSGKADLGSNTSHGCLGKVEGQDILISFL